MKSYNIDIIIYLLEVVVHDIVADVELVGRGHQGRRICFRSTILQLLLLSQVTEMASPGIPDEVFDSENFSHHLKIIHVKSFDAGVGNRKCLSSDLKKLH